MIDADPILPTEGNDDLPLVLIAEDDPTTAEILEITLTRAGYQTRLAQDGETALRMMNEQPLPDIVLLDWMMPKLTGLEVCRRIRETHDALAMPVLLVTANAEPKNVAAAFEAGVSDYITKPFLAAELKARVAAHLGIKRLSEERQSMYEHLMERDKLSTLGLLVSGVAHELNNPLGGIYGYAQVLLEGEREPDRLVAIERIVSEVQRCNRIVADLLSFARRQTPERIPLDLREVLEQTLALRERHLQAHGLWPRLDIDLRLAPIIGDSHQLRQVFLNIILNAEHALRESGSMLKVSARNEEEDGRPVVAITIFNDGPPIPETLRKRIFEPFYTTKEKDQGTGLGLAICQRIVREHRGTIVVQSCPSGTAFRIVVPAAGPEELKAVPPLAPEILV